MDVKNNYLADRYVGYFIPSIDAHVNGRHFTQRSQHWYSQHGVGLPALLPQIGLAAAFVWLHPTWERVEGQNPMHMALHERLGIELRPIMPTFDLHAGLMRGGWQLSAWITVAILIASWGILLAYTRKESNSSPQSRRRSLDAGLRPDPSKTQD